VAAKKKVFHNMKLHDRHDEKLLNVEYQSDQRPGVKDKILPTKRAEQSEGHRLL